MSVLLLRLSGPMQSWGTDSRFDIRFTEREPSKSGVVGLLCAALGKPRQEQPGSGLPTLGELAALRMGVRVDQPGTLLVDYQTAGGTHRQGERYGVVNSAGKGLSTVQSWRYYLADACFLVGLEGDDALLRRLDAALLAPVWQLSLGRKAFVPGEPLRLPDAGLGSRWWGMSLEQALRQYRWLGRVKPYEQSPASLRLVLDADSSGPDRELRGDVPLDFAARRFAPRFIRRDTVAPILEEARVPLAPDPESTRPPGAA